MSDLLRYRKDLKYICADTETVGLNILPQNNFCWSLGWLVVENGQVVKEFDKYPWKPDLKVGADAARITRFNFDEYKRKSEPALDVYNEFIKYYYNPEYLIVGSNFYYDWAIIKALELSLGIENKTDLTDRIYCTHAISKGYKLGMQPPAKKEDFAAWQFSLLSYYKKGLKSGIKAMCSEFSIPYDENSHHGAIADCHYTNKIFKELIWKMELK